MYGVVGKFLKDLNKPCFINTVLNKFRCTAFYG